MSAIEELKNDIIKNWETHEDGTEEKEELQKQDRKIVRKERRMKNFQTLMIYIFVMLLFLWLLFFGVLGIVSAPNNDMNPNLKAGDLLVFNRINKSPSQNEVVVFEKNGTRYVGRVVASEGDTVEVEKTGGFRVNGNAIVESNIYEPTLPREGLLKYPVKLEKENYFVLADARENAEDSRYFGTIKKSDIKGVVIGVFRRTNI